MSGGTCGTLQTARASPLVTLLTAAALAASGMTALSSAARAADADLAANGGFESGLDGWTCTAGKAVTSPVRSGTGALEATRPAPTTPAAPRRWR